jgi:DNA-3-methyladenine glycosylase
LNRLSRRFYARSTLEVAPLLIGRRFVHESSEGLTSGRIVEVEAYCGPIDPGSHAFRGQTQRNSVMFGPPGHLYVYFTYGMHYCCNVVCETEGVPGAVLLRAVEPLEGVDLMMERRGVERVRDLARGPARLCQAFGIARAHNGVDLVQGEIWLEPSRKLKREVLTSKRIGLTPGLDQPWRFYEEGLWVSSLARSRS